MQPKYRFPHPDIPAGRTHESIDAGFIFACIDCTIDFEDGNITELVERSMCKPELRQYADSDVSVRLDLARIYKQVRRLREPAY